MPSLPVTRSHREEDIAKPHRRSAIGVGRWLPTVCTADKPSGWACDVVESAERHEGPRRFGSCGDETLDKIEKERLAGGMDAALAEQSLRQLAPGA
jgi:hypothetical protein